MPEPKLLLNVFLCHASQDKPSVRELAQCLFAEGWIDPWLDEKKILPGQDWRLKIEEAVETSDIVIICLSSSSVSKEGFIQKELRYAREISLEKPEGYIFLIPLRIDECDVPRGLRFYQWVDYFGEKKNETYNALLQSLRLRYAQKLNIEKERLEREAAEKVAREKAEREAAERISKEKEEREAAVPQNILDRSGSIQGNNPGLIRLAGVAVIGTGLVMTVWAIIFAFFVLSNPMSADTLGSWMRIIAMFVMGVSFFNSGRWLRDKK